MSFALSVLYVDQMVAPHRLHHPSLRSELLCCVAAASDFCLKNHSLACGLGFTIPPGSHPHTVAVIFPILFFNSLQFHFGQFSVRITIEEI
jgi:hypothetical protein